jgi:hypothetical protein
MITGILKTSFKRLGENTSAVDPLQVLWWWYMGDCHAHTFLSSCYRCVSHTPKLKQWMTAMREDPAVSAFFLDAKNYQGFLRLYFQNNHEAYDYGLWREQESAVKLCLIFYFTDMTNNMLSFYQILLQSHWLISDLPSWPNNVSRPSYSNVNTFPPYNTQNITLMVLLQSLLKTPKLSSLVKLHFNLDF